MPSDPSLYRLIEFLGGRILEDREANAIQSQSLFRDTHGLGSLYRDGAGLNLQIQQSGSSAVISAINGSFPILAFVRGTFETISPVSIVIPGLTSFPCNVYLNWAINIVTSVDDPTLIDIGTSEPTANMGQLSISLSLTDTSAVGLGGSQLEKNTSPIIFATLVGSFSSWVATYSNNVKSTAFGRLSSAGLVSLTTNTAAGVAVSSDDSRMFDQRTPLPLSVNDSKVVSLIGSGTNTDGSTTYDPATSGQGGITSNKVIYTTLKENLTSILDNIRAALAGAGAAFAGHIGFPLGVLAGPNTTHPFPTAQQVGATPASHVGLNLGRPDSHPPTVADNSGGFKVLQDGGIAASASPTAYAYSVQEGSTIEAGISHRGDIFSLLANASTANGLGATETGTLGLMSKIAAVLGEHVNKYPNQNPHGLAAGDIGAATTGYVDAVVANILAAGEAYTDSKTSVGSRVSTTLGAGVSAVTLHNNPGGTPFIQKPYGQDLITYLILTIGGNFEIAFGCGVYQGGQIVALPESTGWDSAFWLGLASDGWTNQIAANATRSEFHKTFVDSGTRQVICNSTDDDGSDNSAITAGLASIFAIGLRYI